MSVSESIHEPDLPAPIVADSRDLTREIGFLAESLRLLSEARSVDEVKEIRDKAEALRLYAKQQGQCLEIQNTAAEVKIRAERKAGELLGGMNLAQGKRTDLTSSHDGTKLTRSELGIDNHQCSRWKLIAKLPVELFEQYIAKILEAERELTSAGLLRLAKQFNAQKTIIPTCAPRCGGDIVHSLDELIVSGRKFRTIYADPPWRYGNQATRAATNNHYSTMDLHAICAEPVREIVEDDAYLHLWTTKAFFFDALKVMEAWGFKFHTWFVWCKTQMGLGNSYRTSTEYLLFGYRGEFRFLAHDVRDWAEVPRSEHSKKPDTFRLMVGEISPGPYLEMYGRAAIPNSAWTVYGNQIDHMRLPLL